MVCRFIFGYGSLQNFSSIEKVILRIDEDEANIDFLKKHISSKCSCILNTALQYDDKINIVRVQNIKRGFFVNMKQTSALTKSWTALGAYEQEGFTCNGTLFPVTKKQMKRIDKRESGYHRKKIDIKKISILRGYIPENSTVYYYSIDTEGHIIDDSINGQSVNKAMIPSHPCAEFPILQSYVDLCMTGCCQIDKLLKNNSYDYTREFVLTTYEWSDYRFWINDRIYPRRPSVHVPFAIIIDYLLTEMVLKDKQESDKTGL